MISFMWEKVCIHRIEERERKGIELEWMSDRIRGESME